MEQDNFFAILAATGKPLAQDDYFGAQHLTELFQSKIARSQATGKDGVRVKRFQTKLEGETSLIEKRFLSRSYRFTTYKERLILRGAHRAPRQISIPTVRDRLTLRALCQLLHSFVPETRGASPHAMVKEVVQVIRAGDQASKVFLRIDVKDFFPSITHPILNRELRGFDLSANVRELCIAAIRTPTGDKKAVANRGVPQGLSISGALAALYMLKFDDSQRAQGRAYFRYVDDILFICDQREAEDLLQEVSRKLKARGLLIHPKGVAGKTEISPVEKGIDFLGYNICIDKVSIRKSSYDRMFKNILKVITNYRYRKNVSRLIFRINLKITGCIVDNSRRGWMMFFSYTQDIPQLAFLDRFVKDQLSRVGFPAERLSDIKRFVKSYHEIRNNLSETSYIPNFDNYDLAHRIETIAVMTPHSTAEISNWELEAIQTEFDKIISHEVRDLERDVGNIS
ncbi:reverse transcriptase domain-containing protein [Allosphingosinicella humi]